MMRYAIVGGGLAGCECAMVLAKAGHKVTIFEMKPQRMSPAHVSPDLAELVCSNSLRSDEPDAAIGLLKREMESLGSIVIQAARATAVPAGKALAVDRDLFAAHVTGLIGAEPNISVVRQEVSSLDDPALAGFDKIIVAAGPLASPELSESRPRGCMPTVEASICACRRAGRSPGFFASNSMAGGARWGSAP